MMHHKIGLTAGLLAATVLLAVSTPGFAQVKNLISTDLSAQQQQEEKKGEQRKATPAARPAPKRATPQRAAPQRQAPHVAAPRRTQPRVASPQRTAPRTATPSRTAPSTVTRQKAPPRVVRQRKATPKVAAPAAASRKAAKAASPAAAPRLVTPRGTRTVTASRLRGVPARGAGRTVIRGHNYSAWRSGYRVRHGGGWRTFVALSALSAILIGSNEYYPYAYISAPEPYCEGLTEDGCELMWQQVETIEGDVIDQCVAYCPWQ